MAIGSTAREWVTPSTRPQHIDQLINGVDRYNPQNLEVLHQYIGQQLDHGGYDCLANLAILKLYQFNPDQFNYEVVVNILIKAMLSVPYPDFKLCLSLLGEAPLEMDATPLSHKGGKGGNANQAEQSEADGEKGAAAATTTKEASAADENKSYLAGNLNDALILRLAKLSSLLQSSRFRQFWSTLYDDEDFDDARQYTSNVARFEEDVRKIVMDTVASTFRRISEQRLASYLNLKVGEELRDFVASLEQDGWTFEDGKDKDGKTQSYVVAPATADNEIKAVVINEEIPFEQLSKLLSQAQPPALKSSNVTGPAGTTPSAASVATAAPAASD
ncbi:ARM repeat-containing protein [Tilletiaria anomala UBC 951]|uniref:Eukaryotic translation initiation factor 3 subunit K n=1 Tax=Tilletiaria anomala (strain ATCC 24038 / CBS 436.72 / UBC 951) TaxID=1037660 RepID=A0A066WGM3_TILAU|nr:ARM repeat-containing protein [Tilletiaria anomala UBC 951]KDN52936.1 ARM repeat-containing protein [Tilletiaria anomala UBC 951]